MILLDDAQSTAASPTSRLYENTIHYWRVLPSNDRKADLASSQNCLAEISAALSRGEYVVGAFAYELGRHFHKLPHRSNLSENPHPLIEAWSFSDFKKLSKQDVDLCISQKLASFNPSQRNAGVMDIRESLNEARFAADIDAIQEYIRSGDTYQINHTYRITGKAYGAPLALYSRLRDRQPGRFGAYIEHAGNFLLSQSPELFIARDGDTLKAMPMKGTASALSEVASALSEDPKNQAENVMIVDLLRNDLSRISLPGTVTVPNLFEVARHGDVLQMTSTVQGQIKPETTLFDIFKAVFPCGSVTGAPKKRSMEIIQALEPEDRGYYCGALGWLDPNGNFAFSVPIRTVEITEDSQSHTSSFTLGIGAGITNDSDASQEWRECRIKAAFLMDLPSAIGLFETIAVISGVPQRLDTHLRRLSASAIALRMPFQLETAQNLICSTCASLDKNLLYRLRLDLSNTGELLVTTATMDLINEPVKIFWVKDILPGDTTMFSGDALLRHKISNRSLYDQAWQEAVNLGGFDALFVNEQGFVTEGGRTSIFVKPQGSSEWLTPPVSAGLLPGVMRAALLTDPTLNAREAKLTINDVSMADEIMLSNALRGAIKAHF
ncbi:bifunctional chorismate-binding protein/class IV aminotransferase [Polynucleobacter sp. JS-Fieb-80-E5]|uniref:bifunctional chorismate-binding protein/class IV aminotransferase n=1 Tax=Polynucleobacter sp. JS-Fieb-80-E5 TaxID=2081050 RepID=UPI001C0D545D|nr:bifunctional anthranilate synthase component I family protein/class IV aminotransferase [Polynucleobacter sp. JS-Fieb-80-E5]MBU3618626.1 bifunctional anthranilate synthase component I family protein/class IV aminotransferase [Polynucleobacter sp. JS-Fieb-80-E5]